MARSLGHRGANAAHERVRCGGLGQIWGDERPRASGVASSADGRVRCALGGKLFNAAELAAALGLDPSLDDAQLAAELIAREGPAGIARLDGAFGLAAEDDEGLLIARDALGERPLYYSNPAHFGGGASCVFATEIKALLPHMGGPVEPNPAALNAVLVFSFIPGGDTMFAGIHELEPGCYLRLRPNQAPAQPVCYWTPREDIDPAWDDVEGPAQLAALVNQAIARRKPTDGRPVTAFLSGGIDSSAVVALLAEAGLSPLCLSAGFGYGQPNELGYARQAAYHCGVEHRIIDVEPQDFIEILPEIIWRLDDPLCDCITVPNYLLAREAASEASIVFNGEGGDPLFGGPKNKFMILGEWYKPYGGYDRQQAYLASYHKFYPHYRALCTPEYRAQVGGTEALQPFVASFLDDPDTGSFLNRLMRLNIRLKGGHNILVKVDKMLSSNGVRSASPLFDRRVAEFSMRIPPGAKRRGDVEKWAFKKAVESKLPYAIVYRKKAGMGVPLNHWFRKTVLREYTHDMLTSQRARQRGYFEPSFIDALLSEQGPAEQFGRDRSGEMLWMLLAIELWHRVFLEGEGGFVS